MRFFNICTTVLVSAMALATLQAKHTPKFDCTDVSNHTLMDPSSLSVSRIIEVRYTPLVQKRITQYTTTQKEYTQKLFTRASEYFPIIEKYLDKYNMPNELKYLAVVESKLRPAARSGAGALGMWQLMSPTAKELGLRRYHSVDERMDIHASTEAALQYLNKLYMRFNDWGLAIAAYNCGGGCVMRAIESSGHQDYWSLAEMLPEETAKFIPEFIAINYLFSNYEAYGLNWEKPNPDKIFTKYVKIYNHKLYLKDVARLLDVDLDTLYYLNPGYKKNYIPSSPAGYNLRIPIRSATKAAVLIDTLSKTERIILSKIPSLIPDDQLLIQEEEPSPYVEWTLVLKKNLDLRKMLKRMQLDYHQIMYWNDIQSYNELLERSTLDICVLRSNASYNYAEYLNPNFQSTEKLKMIDTQYLKGSPRFDAYAKKLRLKVKERAWTDIHGVKLWRPGITS